MKPNVLEKAYEDYAKEIEQYALQRFEKIVKPYLQANKYEFSARSGSWGVFNKTHRIPENILPKSILFELQFPVPGFTYITLGAWMPNFKSEKE